MKKTPKYKVSVDEKNRRVYVVQRHRPETLVHFVAKQFGIGNDRRNQYLYNKEHGIPDILDDILCLDKLFIASQHKAIVTCDPRDKFDVEVGKQIAIARIDAAFSNAKAMAFEKWQSAMLYKIIKVSDHTFGAGYNRALTKLIDEGRIEIEEILDDETLNEDEVDGDELDEDSEQQ